MSDYSEEEWDTHSVGSEDHVVDGEDTDYYSYDEQQYVGCEDEHVGYGCPEDCCDQQYLGDEFDYTEVEESSDSNTDDFGGDVYGNRRQQQSLQSHHLQNQDICKNLLNTTVIYNIYVRGSDNVSWN